MSSYTLDQVGEKHRAWNQYKRNRCEDNWVAFIYARSKATRNIREGKRNFKRIIASEMKENPKNFCNMVRDENKSKSGISKLGVTLTEDIDKA